MAVRRKLCTRGLLLRSRGRSDKGSTGFKGVYPNHGRYRAACTTSPCRHNNLGTFDTSEEAAQVYLQHYQKEHPEELKKEQARPVLLPIQEHLLIRSDRGQTGYRGVHPDHGRYRATCNTTPCRKNNLGFFGTPEKAAQVYLQHWEKQHPEELEKERVPPLLVQEHLLIPPVSPPLRTGLRSGEDSEKTESCGPGPCLPVCGSSIAVRSILNN